MLGKSFKVIYILHMSALLLFAGFLLNFCKSLNEKPCSTSKGHFFEKILNEHSDLVLVVKQNGDISYVNRPSLDNNLGTLKSLMEPYSKLESLRFKEERSNIKNWLLGGASPSESRLSLLKNSMQGLNELILERPQNGTRPSINKANRDSLSYRRSFFIVEDQSPPSALRKKKIKDSQKISMSLQEVIELFLTDLDRLEDATRDRNVVLSGKIFHSTQAENLGEFENEYSIYDISFSVSKVQKEQALVIVITETTCYHMVSKLEEVTKYKNNILGSFSHVLRTPLNGIINFLTVAKDNEDIPSSIINSIVNPAITCSQQLMYLINDILDYSQLSLKSFTLNFSLQEIKPTIQAVIELFETEARLKGINLKYDITNETPKFIRTDFTRLKQILINLLKSSLNHTFAGEITLFVNYESDWNQLKFVLTDTGIELSNEFKRRLDGILLQNEGAEAELMNIMNEPLGGNIGLIISSRLAKLLGPRESPTGIKYQFDHSTKCLEFVFVIEDRPEGVDFLDIRLISNVETPNREQLNGSFFSKFNNNIHTDHIKHFIRHQSENFELSDVDRDDFAEEIRTDMPKRSSLTLGYSKQTGLSSTQGVRSRVSGLSAGSNNQQKYLHKNSLTQSKFAQVCTPVPRLLSFCSCKSVLIVDDDAFNILSLGELLKSLGVSYEDAFNGEEAIQTISKKQRCCDACKVYSLIFMDCNMPVKDGYETTQILKKKMIAGEINFIPIVACTAYIIDYQSSRCAQVGMDDYICKPVNKAILLSILKRWDVIF